MRLNPAWLAGLVLAGCLAPEKTEQQLQQAVAAHADADASIAPEDAVALDGETADVAASGDTLDAGVDAPVSDAEPADAQDTTPADVPDITPADVPDTTPADVLDTTPADVPDTAQVDAPDTTKPDAPDTAKPDVPDTISAEVDAGPDVAPCNVNLCSDDNPCTTDTCNLQGCAHTAVADGAACSDGKACTADSCQKGVCQTVPVTCAQDATCGEPTGCECKKLFAGDGKICKPAFLGACNSGFVPVNVDGQTVCVPDVPLWGARPLSLQGAFTKNADGTVTDALTLLTWQQAATNVKQTHAQGLAACQGATTAGKTDWRLPTVAELLSIIDYTKSYASTTNDFDLDAWTGYWTVTPNVAQADSQWTVWLNYGYSGSEPPGVSNLVLCVRCSDGKCANPAASKAGPGRFTVAGTGSAATVHDALTDLTWQRDITANAKATWDAAAGLCQALAGGAWRVPNIAELQTIVDRQHVAPAIDAAAFPGTPSDWFWTSTTWQAKPDEGWFVQFGGGGSNHYPKTDVHRVRCVK